MWRLLTLGRGGVATAKAVIDYLGDIGTALTRADSEKLEELYRSLRLEVIYHPAERVADVTISPGRDGEHVRVRVGFQNSAMWV
jgi:hypothetical protein